MGNCAGKQSSREKGVKEQLSNNNQGGKATVATTTPTSTTANVRVSQEKANATTATTTTTTTTTTSSKAPKASTSFNGSKSIQVNKELHKYIIGTKGATVKEIKQESGATNIEVGSDGGDSVTVTGTEDQCNRAIVLIQNTVSQHKTSEQKDKEYNDMRAGHEKESQRTDAKYKKYQNEIDSYSQKRTQLNADADKAYESGDHAKAKELREQAKHQTQLMEDTNKKASREIFADKNKSLDKYTVDLHGLKTKDALELMDERLTELKKDPSSSGKHFTIITGAGNHSDENGPKIKPLIHKTFTERGIKFEEVNNGSIQCTL